MVRSSIDAISSLTTLPLLRDPKDLVEILGKGRPSLEHLLPFLHESTHHWCAGREVGAALGRLAGQIVLEMSDLHDIADDSQTVERLDRLGRLLFRYEAGKELLRPLSEGLALFAEFDIVSGVHSTLISPPYQWLRSIFLARWKHETMGLARVLADEQVGKLSPTDAAYGKDVGTYWSLLIARMLPSAVERKLRLLLNPILLEAGGYLPGYLTVKSSWWTSARKESVLLRETDLFSAFLCEYIYGDPVLAAILVNPNFSESEAVGKFAHELGKRLSFFPDNVTKTALRLFQSSAIPGGRARDLWTSIGRGDEAVEAHKVLEEQDDRFQAEVLRTDARTAFAQALFAGREMLYLGSLEERIWIQRDQANLRLFGGNITLSVRRSVNTVQHEEPIIGDAIRLFATVHGEGVVAVICRGDRAEAVHWLWGRQHVVDDLTPRILDGDLALAGEQSSLARARAFLAALQEDQSANMQRLHAWVLEGCKVLYGQLALNQDSENERADLAARMRVLGLNGLGISVKDLRVLARLSLISPQRQTRQQLVGLYASLNEDLDEALSILHRIEGPLVGLATWHYDDDEVYVVIP